MRTESLRTLGLLLAITLLGAGLRLYRINEIGLSHYDAGVYAQSGLWPWTGQFHFAQGYFSPPLYPFLIGLVNAVAGSPIDWAGPLISAIAATTLIPVGFLVARGWSGERAGLMAALLLAVDPGQILFSRIGLTDELFSLLLIAGFALSLNATEHGGWGRIVSAGLVVGLAWNTKYHGFLAAGLAVGSLVGSNPLQRASRLTLISLIALVIYLPWALWFHVEQGYHTLIEHQRGYFRGLAGWPDASLRGLLSWAIIGPPLVFLVPLIDAIRTWDHQHRLRTTTAVALPFMLLAMMSPTIFRLIGPVLLLGFALVGAWTARGRQLRWGLLLPLAILLFLPGLYSPYARLWLPTETLLILLAACSISEELAPEMEAKSLVDKYIMLALWKTPLILTAMILTYQTIQYASEHHLLRPRAGYRDLANRSLEGLEPATPVQTLCRWPMNYYLATQGRAVQPLVGDTFDPSAILLYDQTAWDTPAFAGNLKQLEADPPGKSWGIDLDLITRLDDVDRPVLQIEELFEPSPKDKLWRYEPSTARPSP